MANKIRLPASLGVYVFAVATIVAVSGYMAWSTHAYRGQPWWPDAIEVGLHFGGMLVLFFLIFMPGAFLFPILGWLFRPAFLWLDRHAPDSVRLTVTWAIALVAFALVVGMLAMGGHALLIKLGWV